LAIGVRFLPDMDPSSRGAAIVNSSSLKNDQ
jgi:hypothetical protein